MATTPEILEMLDIHWQENGISLLDVLDRLGQQSHGLPPFPRELVDEARAEEAEAETHRGRRRRDVETGERGAGERSER